jgi:hypothetical protein
MVYQLQHTNVFVRQNTHQRILINVLEVINNFELERIRRKLRSLKDEIDMLEIRK